MLYVHTSGFLLNEAMKAEVGSLQGACHPLRCRDLGIRAGNRVRRAISAYPMTRNCYAVAVGAIFSSFVRFPLRIWIF
jgi:hypothetical protein